MNFEQRLARAKLEQDEDWLQWCHQIPFIPFDAGWQVKVIPPFGGAMARFKVEFNGYITSVYLDCADSLGCVGVPYWEVYPVDGDTGRCLMHEVDELLDLIRKSDGFYVGDSEINL